MEKRYIGDGVTASFDGYQIWLTTQEGHRIALDDSTYHALVDYWTAIQVYRREIMAGKIRTNG